MKNKYHLWVNYSGFLCGMGIGDVFIAFYINNILSGIFGALAFLCGAIIGLISLVELSRDNS